MNSCVLTFHPNGTSTCLYSELIDLSTLGLLEIRRATVIEFDRAFQKWEVRNSKNKLLYSNRSREVCLAWEYNHFSK